MNWKIENLLLGKGENYIFPFFWQHGEDEETLRTYMKVIYDCGIRSVCVESRPHPDFCGEKWWQDMDVILDEARKREMQVWILDDSHFPTGFANGAMEEQPDELCRQSICCRKLEVEGGQKLYLAGRELSHPKPYEPTMIEEYILGNQRKFDDDRLLAVIAKSKNGEKTVNLMRYIQNNELVWVVPEGEWTVYLLHISRNFGYHRSYINMMNKKSCRILIDAVYEPHYKHYADDFGKTIVGFFSDEPELGNGHLYGYDDAFGTDNDYPWSEELDTCLSAKWGEKMGENLALLWDTEGEQEETAKVRYFYMNAVTRLVQEDFSEQIGMWCRSHGVKYIGHLIEDDNHHSRTGSCLGHYFRGLSGQDMAGIDDIGGQVIPQGEELCYDNGIFEHRNGEFYHYLLAKLASSAAVIEPLKNGNSMCEIFGNYGWEEGVRLEKYLVDHFMVRGVNHFVPHAFSPKPFPDPDCPPHFYAHGNNPQYRHFGELMRYTNRVCSLISSGFHTVSAAILYHGESDWMGGTMTADQVGHILYDRQLDYDVIPQDVFAERIKYHTTIEKGRFLVNTQSYPALIIPDVAYLTEKSAEAVCELARCEIPVYFVGHRPKGVCDGDNSELVQELLNAGEVIRLEDLPERLSTCREVWISPADTRIRFLRYVQPDGMYVYLFVNEGTRVWDGTVRFLKEENLQAIAYGYDAWENKIYRTVWEEECLRISIEPMKSRIIIFDKMSGSQTSAPLRSENIGDAVGFSGQWMRSTCRSIDYPAFRERKIITLPEQLEKEQPQFSGFVRYENTFKANAGEKYLLEISDAHEGVEVFLNGVSQGIQIVPSFRYLLAEGVKEGENSIRIEVATTLGREMAQYPNTYGQLQESTALSGITGEIRLHKVV